MKTLLALLLLSTAAVADTVVVQYDIDGGGITLRAGQRITAEWDRLYQCWVYKRGNIDLEIDAENVKRVSQPVYRRAASGYQDDRTPDEQRRDFELWRLRYDVYQLEQARQRAGR